MVKIRMVTAMSIMLTIATPLGAQQYRLEFSVVGTGGGMTQIGADTLLQTIGQATVGSTAPDSNNAGGFMNELSGGPSGLSFGTYAINDRWNMVAVPFVMGDYHRSVLYPTAISNAFSYQGSYMAQTLLSNGTGYWLKFNGGQTVTLIGAPRYVDSVSVVTGWNMIGGLSVPVLTSSILSVPSGITTSSFFSYNGTYQIATTVAPGQAYWVKAAQAGKLYLSPSLEVPHAGPITIVPGTETPPPAPGPEDEDHQGPPVPSEYTLAQNFPNPFNPSTLIRYDLPKGGIVKLVVYNILGETVATLVDGFQDAGYRSVEWAPANVPSGIYVYRIQAGDFTAMKKMLVVR